MPHYAIKIEPDDNGTFLVTVPAFPEISSFADSEESARDIADKAIEEAIEARICDGKCVPASDVF